MSWRSEKLALDRPANCYDRTLPVSTVPEAGSLRFWQELQAANLAPHLAQALPVYYLGITTSTTPDEAEGNGHMKHSVAPNGNVHLDLEGEMLDLDKWAKIVVNDYSTLDLPDGAEEGDDSKTFAFESFSKIWLGVHDCTIRGTEIVKEFGISGWGPTSWGRKDWGRPLERGPYASAFGLGTMISATPMPSKIIHIVTEGQQVKMAGCMFVAHISKSTTADMLSFEPLDSDD